uniref:Probable enoyl-CoA hydratase, mitochondrial n=1 Tax=Cacopsylla melanoneura TaxID=428564 RepID=A0A8D9DR87_9HEMI
MICHSHSISLTKLCSKIVCQKHHCITQHSSRLNSTVCSKKISNITLISINRPNKRNAMDSKTIEDLQKNIGIFENDQDSPCAVLHGQGGNFSSGFDMMELYERPNTDLFENFRKFLQRPAKKPIIAAVNGYAVGQGLDLALWCDLRFVEENALMGFYNKRFAIPTCDVTIKRLKHMIGASRTLSLVLDGKHITSREALDWGLSTKMVSCGTAIGEAVDKALKLSRLEQDAMLEDRATLLSHCSLSDENSMLNTNVFLKNSQPLIEKFVKKEYGRHGVFKNPFYVDNLDFLHS